MNWWHNYNCFSGEKFAEFWSAHGTPDRRILFVVGLGFDPRALKTLNAISDLSNGAHKRCLAIDVADSFSGDERSKVLQVKNHSKLMSLFRNSDIEVRSLNPNDADGVRSVSRNTVALLGDHREFDQFTDVIVDISSLPRIVYLSILNSLLGYLVNPEQDRPLASVTNLHVVYAEAAAIDGVIQKKELEPDLAAMQRLSIRLDEEVSQSWPKIWFPILGEGNREMLERIFAHVNPNDVCPILPMQTNDARRSDDIVRDVGDLMFDRFLVDPRDLIYATEDNPFQLYRNLLAAMARYEDSLGELGGVRFIVSPLSSKGLSIGALLAHFESQFQGRLPRSKVRTGFAYIESIRYEAGELIGDEEGTPVSLWLTGSCYKG